MEKMMQDNDYPGVDGHPFTVKFNREEYEGKPEAPKWEPIENVLLREKVQTLQLFGFSGKEIEEILKNESKQGIQDNKQG
jgi:hypothetical protein